MQAHIQTKHVSLHSGSFPVLSLVLSGTILSCVFWGISLIGGQKACRTDWEQQHRCVLCSHRALAERESRMSAEVVRSSWLHSAYSHTFRLHSHPSRQLCCQAKLALVLTEMVFVELVHMRCTAVAAALIRAEASNKMDEK